MIFQKLVELRLQLKSTYGFLEITVSEGNFLWRGMLPFKERWDHGQCSFWLVGWNRMASSPYCGECQSFVPNHISSNLPASSCGKFIILLNDLMLSNLRDQLSDIFTSPPEYHGRQAVWTGSFSVFMEYLDAVTGTRPSVSPLQISLTECLRC